MDEIPLNFRIKKKYIAKHYILNGKLCIWKKDFFDVYSPIRVKKDGRLNKFKLGSYPLMDEDTALKVLDSAFNAYDVGKGKWAIMSFSKRIKYFEKFLVEFQKVREEVVKLLMWEIGKNESAAYKEFDRTIDYIEDTIAEVKQRVTFSNDLIEQEGVVGQIKRSPLGVTLCMGPYNYPLNESFTTLIPAMLMGNTIIFKPPKAGVLLHNPIVKIFAKVFPAGVFNIVYGEGEKVIKPIMETGKVNVLAFIGSSKVANIIQRYHPKPNRLKLVLGLEAKNVGIVMADCDIDTAVNECVIGSLSYNGQRCTALKLLFVHEKIAPLFLKKFVRKVDALSKGLPFDDAFITPVLDESLGYYNDLVTDAISKGAKIINHFHKDQETFFCPKILYPVSDKMDIYKKEQFGPVVPIVPFKSIDKPINAIVNSNYGQQCAIFSKDAKKIGGMIDLLINQVSRINLNSQCQRGPDSFPFTGRKDSAVETLSISHALKVFSIRTLVSTKVTDANKEIYKKILEKNYSEFLKKEILL